MSGESVIKTRLFVHKHVNKLARPQKCKVPSNLMRFPAASLVIVKSESERKFLCRLFYCDEAFDGKAISYLDDSVELHPRQDSSAHIRYVKDIEHIPSSQLCKFQRVRVKLFVNPSKLDLNIIKTPADLAKAAESILRHYTFANDCMISVSDERYGISKIYAQETGSTAFGDLSQNDATIALDSVKLERPHNATRELGGLGKVQALLSDVMAKTQRSRSHVLLHGPSGTGKTSLIHHLASQHKCNLFEITSDIFKPYPGETEEELSAIFERIKAITELIPTNLSIVLIENIEIFCPKIDAKLREASHSSRVASLIYSYLDELARGSSNSKGILVIGTSSKIELVNIALRRVSRMGIEISLDMPNECQRYEIVRTMALQMLGHVGITDDNIDELSSFVAEHTTGFVGADLETLCQYVLRQRELHANDDIHHLFECGFRSINPSVMRDNFGTITRSTMTLADIGGMAEVKKSLTTCILGPLRHADQFRRLGLRSPSGILLYGPSGCAKTSIVKCLAGESKMTLISVSSAEIYSPYVGEGEKFIVKLFNQARMSAPAILFFDEIDTIVGSRSLSGGSSDAHMRILSTLLTEIDGFGGGGGSDSMATTNRPILIIGATNRPECIDDALMRPGRFDKLIHIPAPDLDQRLHIFHFLFSGMPIADDVDVAAMAERTNLYSGADLVNLCNEAAMCAATRDLNCDTITADDFESVLAFIGPSLDVKRIKFYQDFAQRLGKNY